MLAPTPVLKPGPLDIGDLFSAGVTALKRSFGLFVLLALLPGLLTLAFVAVGVLLMVGALAATAGLPDRGAPDIMIVIGVLISVVGVIAGGLAQVKAYGMMSLTAYEIAQGQRPTFRGVLARSRGFLPRMVPLIAIGVGLVVVLYALIFAALFGTMSAASDNYRDPIAALAVLFGVLALLFIVLIPLAVFFGTKLLYTVPAIALEGMGGIDGLKRSWRLTRGSFWRTFGSYVVAYLAVTVVSYIVGYLAQLLVLPFGASVSSIPPGASPAEIVGRLSVLLPLMAIVTVLQLVVNMFALPFLQTYTTYMFIDQVRRSEMPPAPAYGYPVPGYYAQPGPPQPGYPVPGYPAQGYGHPAAPPYPGQSTPGQPYPTQPYPGQGWQPSPGWPGPQLPQQPSGQPYPQQGWSPSQGQGGTPPHPSQFWGRPPGSDSGADDQQRP